MDPPLISDASFANYSLAELLSFPAGLRMGAADGLADISAVTAANGAGKRGRDVGGGLFVHDASAAKIVSGINVAAANQDVKELNAKRNKSSRFKDENDALKTEVQGNSGANMKPVEMNKAEPPKDYIHVRARRGQATDSHSLAERARREKISERMKILQDLVPGCNKVIGKALVLDEIINYIQSLQNQVEFLSMKLEAVNSRLSPIMEEFPLKDLAATPAFDPNAMFYGPGTPGEYGRGSIAEWLHMHVGSGFD